MPAATATSNRPSRNAQRAIRSGWASCASITARRRRAGVGWPVIVIVRRSATGSGCRAIGSAGSLVDFLSRPHEAAGVGDGVLRLGTLAGVEPLGDLDLALPLEEDRFLAHLVVILPQGAGTG